MTEHEMGDEEVSDLGRSGLSYLVTGTMTESGLTCELALTLWDAATRSVINRFTRSGQRFTLGAMLLELDAELRAQFGDTGAPDSSWYVPPGPDLIDGYLGSLARSLTLFMAQKGVVPRDQLVGEPNLLQWLADFAGATASLPVPPIILTAGLAADRAMGSDAYLGFKELALGLVGREQDQTRPFYRVAPLLLQMFGDESGYADRCAALMENGDAALLEWLSTLEEQPK